MLLEKTNCRKCNKPTCLAFAAAVFQGQMLLSDCPFVDKDIIETYPSKNGIKITSAEQDFQKRLDQFKEDFRHTDLKERAEILGEIFSTDKITLKVMGKDFSIDTNGNVFTLLHVNHWLTLPVFNYVLHGKGLPLTNNWVPFRELETSKDWIRFFEHQCIDQLKRIADSNPSFFEDVIDIFNAEQVEDHYDADITLVLKPLPLLPILICYNRPEDGLDSSLNLFFDSTADKNLPIDNIYTLITGLTRMLEKLAKIHG